MCVRLPGPISEGEGWPERALSCIRLWKGAAKTVRNGARLETFVLRCAPWRDFCKRRLQRTSHVERDSKTNSMKGKRFPAQQMCGLHGEGNSGLNYCTVIFRTERTWIKDNSIIIIKHNGATSSVQSVSCQVSVLNSPPDNYHPACRI